MTVLLHCFLVQWAREGRYKVYFCYITQKIFKVKKKMSPKDLSACERKVKEQKNILVLQNNQTSVKRACTILMLTTTNDMDHLGPNN